MTKPIASSYFNERVQIDLIDLQTKPDASFKIIFVMKDQFTHYVRLRPLEQKSRVAVAKVLWEMFGDFGAPKILHCDNRREFKTKQSLIKPLCKTHIVSKTQIHGTAKVKALSVIVNDENLISLCIVCNEPVGGAHNYIKCNLQVHAFCGELSV